MEDILSTSLKKKVDEEAMENEEKTNDIVDTEIKNGTFSILFMCFSNYNSYFLDEEENIEDKNGETLLTLYPWESNTCKDYNHKACEAFKPFCDIMGVIAYKKCAKTCNVCPRNKPKNKGLMWLYFIKLFHQKILLFAERIYH